MIVIAVTGMTSLVLHRSHISSPSRCHIWVCMCKGGRTMGYMVSGTRMHRQNTLHRWGYQECRPHLFANRVDVSERKEWKSATGEEIKSEASNLARRGEALTVPTMPSPASDTNVLNRTTYPNLAQSFETAMPRLWQKRQLQHRGILSRDRLARHT